MPSLNLRNLDAAETAAALAPFGVGADVARRVFARVHRDWATTLDGVRGLSHAQIRAIAAEATWPELEVIERRRATDGFEKYLFRLGDR
ncbi:MAG TPA: rRNA methyltransferase, partial [Polyangia bacterium]|nr:rRNA methyltransferase [Polyangia bacterium]